MAQEVGQLFDRYFHIFPWKSLPADAEGFDLGCGSGRWARMVAPRVGRLHCIDASPDALGIAKRNLVNWSNCSFHVASVDEIPLKPDSQDFGYSVGVLHHVPDTLSGIRSCVSRLKAGAPFLLYLYYAFDNRPAWFRALWRVSDGLRRIVARSPWPIRWFVSQIMAAIVYFPLARLSLLLEKMGRNVANIPLSQYRRLSFYTMRTDALDRFGTRLEQRFHRDQVERMMKAAGLEGISFSDQEPYWCAVGYRAGSPHRDLEGSK